MSAHLTLGTLSWQQVHCLRMASWRLFQRVPHSRWHMW